MNLISPVIEQEESLLLEIVPLAEEIFDIVKSMGATKAPDPDGLPPLFFKEYWHIISRDIVAMVQIF